MREAHARSLTSGGERRTSVPIALTSGAAGQYLLCWTN